MNPKILFVDDDACLLEAVQRALRKQFDIECAVGSTEGLRKLATHGPYALVVADMQMPEMSGLEFLRAVRKQDADTVRIMLTGNSDQKTAVDAVNDGHVFRFLTKPCPPPVLVPALEAGLAHYQLVKTEHDLLENTLGGAVKILTEVLAISDPATFERSNRLKNSARDFMLASDQDVPWELELAAMLCQIGRVTIPPVLLEKVRDGFPLTAVEESLLEEVPAIGARLLKNIPRLENVVTIVNYQQKHFDGSGYPADSTVGNEIPIGGRILKVLGDLLDLESKGITPSQAIQEMRARIGWYDLEVLSAVSRWCDVSITSPKKTLSSPVSLPIAQIQCGQILAQELRTESGLLLMAAHTELTAMLLAKIKNFAKLNTIDSTLLVYAEL